MILMICLTALPVMTVTWFAANNTQNSVEKEILDANISRMKWVDQYLYEMIKQVESMFYSLQTDTQLMHSMNDIDSPDTEVQFNTLGYIRNALYSVFCANYRKVDKLTFYIHSNKKAFSVSFSTSVTVSTLDIQDSSWSRILDKPVNLYFKKSDDAIYGFHSLNRYEDLKLIGGLSVRINNGVWDSINEVLQSEGGSSTYLISDKEILLSNTTETKDTSEIQEQLDSMDLQNPELVYFKKKNYYYFIKKIGDGQLTVVKAIPLTTITQSALKTVTAGILTGSLFSLLSILLAILISLRFSRPIVQLAKTMRMAQIQDFEMKPIQYRDEIGLLEHSYNSMMQRIKDMIENEYQKSIELKNAQLMALQAQINPHFLNNTLQLIGGIALSKNVPEIYQIVLAISDLFRYSICTGDDMVSLNDELQHMRNYIFIQEHRFVGQCKIVFSIDETLLDSRLPKFTIQPIVENAFEHGLRHKEGIWIMEIRIKRIKNRIVIMVKDNGIGISKERLEEVRTRLRNCLQPATDSSAETNGIKSRKGIGMQNINARLKLQFGNGYGTRIFSKPGEGALVVLTLPIVKGKDATNV